MAEASKQDDENRLQAIALHHVLPAEPCELCGEFAVEWEFKHDGQTLRRCNTCVNRLRTKGFKLTVPDDKPEPAFPEVNRYG